MSRQDIVTQHFDASARDGSYAEFYASTEHTPHNHDFLARVDCVERLLSGYLKRGMTVLDLGCGPGPISDFVLSQGARYTGVDVSQAMLDRVPKRDGVETKIGSSEAIPFGDNSFDAVVGMGLIEYFDDPRLTLKEIARVTRRNGLAVVTVPNKRSLNRFILRHSEVVTMLYRMRKPASKVIVHREFTPGELNTDMTNFGFRRVGEAYYDFKLLPYPITRISSQLAFMINRRVEGKLPGFFANGYIGSFQKQ